MNDDIALEGGTWQPVRGVLRWVPDPPPLPDDLGAPGDFAGLIACPTCRAKVTQTCRTTSGHTRDPHANRLTPRFCACGVVLPARRRLCEPCASEALRISKRDHLRRLRGTPPERYRDEAA